MLDLAELSLWWQNHRPTTRRLAQLYCALLYNANLKGFLTGKLFTGNSKALCVPGLNCYSCPGAVGACPLGSLQNALANAGHGAVWYVFGLILLFGITLGRTVCGWLCPMGLIQELLHKIPTPKLRKSRITRVLSWLKYIVLGVFVIAYPLLYGLRHGMPLPAFCKYICPAGTLEGAVVLLSHPENSGLFAQLGILFTRKFVILLAIGLACIFCYRSFCRFLCPLGALYGLFSRFALTGVKVDPNRCSGCGACVRNCPMDVRRVGDRECISCGACMNHCSQGAISIRCGRAVLSAPGTPTDTQAKRRARVRWIVLLILLAVVLLAVNLSWGSPSESWTSDAAVGAEVGQQLADFTCTLTDGTAFHLADYRGQIVIINQWATYCTPCVGELPSFERLQEEHPEIVILAVHHWLEAVPKAVPYIAEMGWDQWKIRFAVDTKEDSILDRIHGDNTMPRTVVLNRRGEVVYNEQRSVTYEMLLQLLALADP